MLGVNDHTIVGNLGRDPEIRYSKKGDAIASFSVASTSRYKIGDEWKDHTEWFNVVVFGKLASACEQYLAKGSPIYLRGRIQTRTWQDKDGNTRYTTEHIALDCRFLAKKEGKPPEAVGEPPEGYDGSGDDVPF